MRLVLLTLSLLAVPVLWTVFRPSKTKGGSPVAPAAIEPPPTTLHMPGGAPFDVAAHLFDGAGIPILDFDALEKWASTAPTPEETRNAIDLGRRAWLLYFRESLGASFTLTEIPGVWVLSPYPSRVAQAAARYIGNTAARIARLLPGLARFPAGERSILVVLDSQEDYYRYVANYYPDEGEFAFSGGMFINAGCPHFVAVVAELAQLEPVITHEMTHYSLAHLDLPLWLDEGIAVNSEDQLSSTHRHPQAALELVAKHQVFWTASTIQEFWAGKSFHRTDEGNELSYDLARRIVDLIGREWDNFVRFASAAQRADGGAGAAHTELGMDLGELAAAALNMRADPRWSPEPGGWEGVSRKATRPRPGRSCAPCG